MTIAAILEQLAQLFLPSVRLAMSAPETDIDTDATVVKVLRQKRSTPIDPARQPLLLVPNQAAMPFVSADPLVLVAVERTDVRMAAALTELLNPDRARLAVAHVTWLPGTASSPTGGAGLDDPLPSELLAYDGARVALLDTAGALRAAGFRVSTHLREDRDREEALAALVAQWRPTLLVLGRGKHGLGPGRHIVEADGIPALLADSRG